MQYGTPMWQRGHKTNKQTNCTQMPKGEDEQPHRTSKREKLSPNECKCVFSGQGQDYRQAEYTIGKPWRGLSSYHHLQTPSTGRPTCKLQLPLSSVGLNVVFSQTANNSKKNHIVTLCDIYALKRRNLS